MRLLTAAVALAALAGSASAGPMDPWEYRAVLRTNLTPVPGPAHQPFEAAYMLGTDPGIGVIAGSVPDWTPANRPYPAASFWGIGLGRFSAFAAGEDYRPDEVSGGGQYRLDVEIRDPAGRVGATSLVGYFNAWWWGGSGGVSPDSLFIPPDHNGGPMITTRRSVWVGRTRYDLEFGFGEGGPFYREDGSVEWWPADSFPNYDGAYWVDPDGFFSATVTAAAAPEPGTLALAAIGLGGLVAVRRVRRRLTATRR